MATNTAQERMLKRLEGKYNTPAEKHIAEYNTDKLEVQSLLRDKVIDADHAAILLGRIQSKYEAATAERKEAKKLAEQKANLAAHGNIYPRAKGNWFQRMFAQPPKEDGKEQPLF